MPRLEQTKTSRVTHDPHTELVRSWFDLEGGPVAPGPPQSPREFARAVLVDSADLFGWDEALSGLRDGPTLHSSNEVSVRFLQYLDGIPVRGGEVVVNSVGSGRVHSIYNHFRYGVSTSLLDGAETLDPRRASRTAEALAKTLGAAEVELSVPRLVIERSNDEPRSTSVGSAPYVLAFQVDLSISEPFRRLQLVLDATTGQFMSLHDLLQYGRPVSP